MKDVNPGVLDGLNMLISSNSIVNNELIFYAQEPSTGLEIWKTDGTSFGTQILKDLTSGPQSSIIHAFLQASIIYCFLNYLIIFMVKSYIGLMQLQWALTY
ncbi:MAG: hypothetical protein IPF75_00095 [Bacteroidetes bacterium]|nr:hypothetical protein [Bacteroidota bacterium]